MGGRRNEEKRERGRRNSGGKEERKKKSLLLALTGQVSSAGLPVCGTGGGGWKDWFHFSPLLGHSLGCCSASSPVPQSPCAPH